MMKKKIILLSLLSGLIAANGIGAAVAISKLNSKLNASDQKMLERYTFKAKDNFKDEMKNHLASEFSHSSNYNIFSIENDKNPFVKFSQSGPKKYFWETTLLNPNVNGIDTSIINTDSNFGDKKFELIRDDKAPLDIFASSNGLNRNLLFHSFANDEKGTLYLYVYVEDKENSRIEKFEDRVKKFVAKKLFKLEGFKKFNPKLNNNKITRSELNSSYFQKFNYEEFDSFSLKITESNIQNFIEGYISEENEKKIKDLEKLLDSAKTTNNEPMIKKYSEEIKKLKVKKHFETLEEFMSILPTDASTTDVDKINKGIRKVKDYFNFKDIERSVYEIDKAKPFWLSTKKSTINGISRDVIIFHYHQKLVIPTAEDNDLSLVKKYEIEGTTEKEIVFNWFDMKNIEVNLVTGKNQETNSNYLISEINPTDTKTITYNTNIKNDNWKENGELSKGVYTDKNGNMIMTLIFKNNDLNDKYYLTWNLNTFNDTLAKRDTQIYSPLISFDEKNGKARFMYKIKEKHISDKNFIESPLVYYGIIEVDNFKH
ncbi:MAG1430 family protein [Mycoplasma sp. Mirounga ES2805-ORL]|uniref:MAG1430 family protein n=1 Tax=Mycoplasma sp. Mirounga ES2805-ORL TaxID=754514 RepID=UPI00197C4A9A|nr:hypothetical protein [Mycoplasma sp. Mirounga ES2805-ORL]QSF13846.1 hypothetical protein JXZ90_00905 [Mycoplasma sp. Mirounga ES2805-ORL]